MNLVLIEAFFVIALWAVISDSINTKSNKTGSYQISRAFSSNVSQNDQKIFKSKPKLVCFYVFTNAFDPKIMDELCTHINVGFLSINKENNIIEISVEQEQLLQQVTLLKKNAEDLKVIISVGGAGDSGFSSMIKTHATRKKFIRSSMELIKKFKIDGMDLDWEWPVVESGNYKEKVKFVQLLREIRKEFDLHNKKYILSADVSSVPSIIELGYYVKYIADFVDYVNVMCYDYRYFTKLYPFTGHNSPLYLPEYSIFLTSINISISFWISNSMPREKILVGVPTYGHTFRLLFANQHFLNSPAIGFGSVGENGFADYHQICEFLKLVNTTVIYDEVSKVPYAYNSQEWISFDDEISVAVKANYVLEENLGGAMVFSVNADDFDGTCKGNGVFLPLIRSVRSIFFNKV